MFGKILLIFLVVVLVSTTVYAFYLYKKEVNKKEIAGIAGIYGLDGDDTKIFVSQLQNNGSLARFVISSNQIRDIFTVQQDKTMNTKYNIDQVFNETETTNSSDKITNFLFNFNFKRWYLQNQLYFYLR